MGQCYNFGMKLMFKYFLDAIRRYRTKFLWSLFLSVLSALALVLIPLILKLYLNQAKGSLGDFALALGLIIILLSALIYIEIRRYISLDRFGGIYIASLLSRLQKAALTKDELSLSKASKNQLEHIMYADVLDAFRVVGNYLPNISSSFLVIATLFIFSIFIDQRVALFLLVANILGFAISYVSRLKARQLASRTNFLLKKLHKTIESFSFSLNFIKTRDLDGYYEKTIDKEVTSFIDSSIQEDKTIYFYSGIISRSLLLLEVIFSMAMSIYLTNDPINIIVYALIFNLAMNESSKAETTLQMINRSYICFENIDRILITKDKDSPYKINAITDLKIDLKRFSYDQKTTVLKNLKIHLKKGDCVLIKGDNGSGKSTLIKLLAGLLDDYDGDIKVNDLKLSMIRHESLVKKLIYIAQNDYFIDDTLENYLKLVTKNEHLDQDEIKETFKRLDLELDPKTMIDTKGSTLSGGQKKKLEMAYLLLLKDIKGKLIILDELKAGLDEKGRLIYKDLVTSLSSSKSNIILIIEHEDIDDIPFCKVITLS